MKKVLVDGQLIDREEASVDIEDRGYQFGDGIYEVIRVYNGQIFTADEHLNRLYSSAEKIQLHIPFQKEELMNMINLLVSENEVEDGSVYMQVTRGAARRNHVFPGEEIQPVLTAYTNEVPRPDLALEDGVHAITAEDIRWLRCDIKSLNLLPNLLAKQEALEKGCQEAILHRDGVVTEGSSSNVFIVKDGVIQTHPATNLILNGITRQVVLRFCQTQGIPVSEEPFQLEDLNNADEVFITSTTSEIMPIIMLDEKEIANGKPGPITRKLQSLFLNEIRR